MTSAHERGDNDGLGVLEDKEEKCASGNMMCGTS